MDDPRPDLSDKFTLAQVPELKGYISQHCDYRSDLEKKLEREIMQLPRSMMCGDGQEADLFAFLIKLNGMKRALEVGTFRGLTTLSLALALPSDGKVVTLDINDQFGKDIAPRYWKEAGVASKIEWRIGPAADTMQKMIYEREEPFDLIFIDAEKTGYDHYYELSLQLLKPKGIIAIDNTLFRGSVLDPGDCSGAAIHALNVKIKNDPRVIKCHLSIVDGLTLVSKV